MTGQQPKVLAHAAPYFAPANGGLALPGVLAAAKPEQIIGVLSAVIGLVLLIATPPAAISPEIARGAGITILFLGIWATKTVPDHVAAIVFFAVAAGVAGIEPEIVFSGFHSGAVWLVLAGFIIGVAIKLTGLGDRIAGAVLQRTGTSYPAVVTGCVAVGAMMIFVLPSGAGRIVILTPIVMTLADRLGFEPGSRGRNGMILGAVLSTMLPAYGVLPSMISNMAMDGMAQTLYGVGFSYGGYLAANFAVMGTLVMIALPVLICVLFRDTPTLRPDMPAAKPMSRDELCLILLIGITSLIWFTDFLHGISPAWVGLAAAGMCLMPGIGPARTASFSAGISFGTWFLLAAVVGLGAVIDHTGLGMAIGQEFAGLLDLTPGEPARNFASLVGIGMAVTGTATIVGAPAVMTALAEPLTVATGLPIETVLLAQVPSWTFFIFPYQMPILLIGMGIARVPFGQATRLLVAMTAFGLIVVLPLQFLWLRALGYFA